MSILRSEVFRRRCRRVLWIAARLAIYWAVMFSLAELASYFKLEKPPTESELYTYFRAFRFGAWNVLRVSLLVWLFGRDMCVLGRYLGPAMKPGKACSRVAFYMFMTVLVTGFVSVCFLLYLPERFSEPELAGNEFIRRNLVEPIVRSGRVGPLEASLGAEVFILGPLAEEILFRGALFLLLLRVLGPFPAVVLSSVVFAGYHQTSVGEVNLLSLVRHSLAGVALCIVFLRTHRLRWPILFHSMWNTCVTTAEILLHLVL